MSRTYKTSILLIFILRFILAIADNNAFARQFKKMEVKLIGRIEIFLNNLETIQGSFIQFSDINEEMSEGKFYVKKPQKFWFEYTNPNHILMICGGDLINYYDKDLDEITIIPASKTPIPLLFSSNFGLKSDKSNLIDLIINSDGTIKISLRISIEEMEYFVEYTFDKQVTNILKISIIDENKQETTLSLYDIVINAEIKDSIFIFKNPRLYRNRR